MKLESGSAHAVFDEGQLAISRNETSVNTRNECAWIQYTINARLPSMNGGGHQVEGDKFFIQ
jgi:hypothetical protein